MLRNLLKACDKRVHGIIRTYTTNHVTKLDVGNEEIVKTALHAESAPLQTGTGEEGSVLSECKEDISHVAPYLKPTFNFAAYVNKSETLQKLVHLGVDLYKLEKKTEVPPFILQLDFERDVEPHLMFLHRLGVETEAIGAIITKNPFILKESLDNLEVRVNYLKCKKFDNEMIARIVSKNPMWLSFSTQDIDKKLGFFQQTYKLTGKEVRELATKSPKLITWNSSKLKTKNFVIKEEMGFNEEEIKSMLLDTPLIFLKDPNFILKSFEYVHKQMNLSLEFIAKAPRILIWREFKITQRHLFLKQLGKDQFDPTKPLYVSPLEMVSGTDAHFATEVAGSSIQAYNAFLKTL